MGASANVGTKRADAGNTCAAKNADLQVVYIKTGCEHQNPAAQNVSALLAGHSVANTQRSVRRQWKIHKCSHSFSAIWSHQLVAQLLEAIPPEGLSSEE